MAQAALFLCLGGSSRAQEADKVPDAQLRAKLPDVLQSAELLFIDDDRLMILRHFSRKNEPVISAVRLPKEDKHPFVSELFAPLVGSNLFGKAELDSELFGSARRDFRAEGVRLALSPDGRSFLTSSFHAVRLWDLAKGTPVGPGREHGGHLLAAFTNDSKRVLTMALISGMGIRSDVRYEVRLWDAASMDPIGEPASGIAVGIKGPLTRMKTLLFTPDDKSFVTAYGGTNSMSKFVQFWDAKAMQPIGDPLPAEGDYHQFSPDGKTLTVIGKKEMTVWEVSQRKLISKLLTPEIAMKWSIFSQRQATNQNRWFAVHPDGTSVLYANKDRAELWDLRAEPPRKKKVLEHPQVYWVEISRDGKQAATAGAEVFVWDLETGKRTLRIPCDRQDGSIKSMKFSPNGRLLAIVNDRDVRIWSLQIPK